MHSEQSAKPRGQRGAFFKLAQRELASANETLDMCELSRVCWQRHSSIRCVALCAQACRFLTIWPFRPAMDIRPFFIYFLPVLTVVAVGALGSTRRLGFWLTLLLAIGLTPIGGLIVAMLSGHRKPQRVKRRAPPPKPLGPSN